MNLNKILKSLSIIFECSFAGSVILYIYNYYVGSKKYEVIPEALQKNLNIFIIIAIISIILFVVLKYIIYLRNKENIKDEPKTENKYRNLEEAVTERVIIYKDSYDVPKEKRMVCPNCNNIIDKNAYICIKCGYLLKPIVERVIEKHYTVNNTRENSRNYNMIEKKKLINIIVNVGLVIAIVICLLLIINIAMERGIIG